MAKAVASSLYSSRCIKGQDVLSELDRSRPFFMVVLSVLLTLAIVGAIFYIGLRVKVVNLGYRINQEIQSKERIIEENKRLSLEIAQLKSPTRIEFEAKERLGLQLPAPHQIVYIGENAAALDANLAKIKPFPVPKPVTVAAAAPAAKPKVPAEKTAEVKTTAALPVQSVKPKARSVAALKTAVPAKAAPVKPAAQIIAKPAKKEPTASVTAEKASSPILVAKIVRAKEEKTLIAKKPTEAKPRSAGEGIPAAMLDTMP